MHVGSGHSCTVEVCLQFKGKDELHEGEGGGRWKDGAHLKLGVLVQNLHLSSEAGTANLGASWQLR